ncbi:hypothetical protein EBT31_11610 [bacterium]|nr:hypothetical protein [bacterium]
MPEAITITEQETSALSPENEQMLAAMNGETVTEEEGDDQLLAGKYKSVEDLEKAYKELQSKLGQRTTDDEEESADGDEPAVERDSDVRSAAEIYGEFIGTRLEEAGVDYLDINSRWQQNGELSVDDYQALEGAGFSREMVDSYLTGLQYRNSQDSALSMQEVAAVKQEYGGEAEYNRMIEWAGSNLTKDEIDGFNQLINTQPISAVRLAIAGLHARYTGAEGREPKLLGGRPAKGSTDKFESTAQLVEAMKDPRYQNDSAYRNKVQAKLSRSSIF